jgi:DNA-binding transcriptional MerR regulator
MSARIGYVLGQAVDKADDGSQGGPRSLHREFGAAMTTYSISKIARAFELSRSTLLYYHRIGILEPSGRTGAGYRYYTEKDHRRLERICHFRQAGLTLKDIHGVLLSGGKPGVKLLEERIRETATAIVDLKNQQRVLAGMLGKIVSGSSSGPVDKKLWVEMLQAAGMDKRGRKRWHTEFERRAPEAHNEFLLSLGIPHEEVAEIRCWSRCEVNSKRKEGNKLLLLRQKPL